MPPIAQTYICVGEFGIAKAGGFVQNSEPRSAVHRARMPCALCLGTSFTATAQICNHRFCVTVSRCEPSRESGVSSKL